MSRIIPSFEYCPVVTEDRQFTDQWRQIITILLQYLQTNLSDNGWALPSRTTTEIAALAALPATVNGTMWYDSTLDVFKGKKGGIVVTFNTTP